MLRASVPPESERRRQQNQDANNREAPRNRGTKVCCGVAGIVAVSFTVGYEKTCMAWWWGG